MSIGNAFSARSFIWALVPLRCNGETLRTLDAGRVLFTMVLSNHLLTLPINDPVLLEETLCTWCTSACRLGWPNHWLHHLLS